MIWNKITHKNFEKLAFEYAKYYYPDYDWIATDETCDDNHDFYYNQGLNEGWGEAKHADNPSKSMSKDKWDSTILSGKMAGNVHHIMFVTNAIIPMKYILRAELLKRTPFHKFDYITNEQLEKFLLNNPNVFHKFFPKTKISVLENIPSKDFETNIHITEMYNPNNLKDRNSIFQQNKDYMIFFVFKSLNRISLKMKFSKNINLMPIDIIDFDNLILEEGYTCFKQMIRFKGQGKSVYFKFSNDKLEINKTIRKSCDIIPSFTPEIIFAQQKQIIYDINRLIDNNKRKNMVIDIISRGGNGKTYIFNQIINDKIGEFSYTRITFKNEDNYNLLSLYKLQLIIIFGVEVFMDADYFYTLSSFFEKDSNNIFPNDLKVLYNIIENHIVEEIETVKSIMKKIFDKIPASFLKHPLSSKTVILLEDVYKLNDVCYEYYKAILNDFLNLELDSVIIQSYRPFEFISKAMQKYISDTSTYKFSFSIPTYTERVNSIKNTFSKLKNISLLSEGLHLINTTMMFKNFLFKINEYYEKNIYDCSIIAYAMSKLDQKDSAFFEKELLTDKKLHLLIFLIYGFEHGCPITFIDEYLPNEKENLLVLNYRTLINIENDKATPAHDFYLDVFNNLYDSIQFDNIRKDVVKILSAHLNHFTNKEIVLSVILKYSSGYEYTYLKLAEMVVNKYYEANMYDKVFPLITQIINMKGISDVNTCWDINKLWLYFINADCLDHLGKLKESSNAFKKICEEGVVLNIQNKGFILNSKAQILNLQFALLECKEGLSLANAFIKEIPINIKNDADDQIDAKLNAINRKFMLEFSLDLYEEGIKTNNLYYGFTLNLNRKDHQAYSYIDFARCIYHLDPEQAFCLMKKAYKCFSLLKNQKRRKLDSAIEKHYLDFILHGRNYEKLEKYSEEAYKLGLKGIYRHSLLKRAACMIIHNELERAESILSKLHKLFNLAVEDDTKRTTMLYYNQMAAIAFAKKDYQDMKQYIKKYNSLAKNLGDSYMMSKNVPNSDTILFNFAHEEGFKLETRIW